MSINTMKQSGHTTYNIVEFVIDTVADLTNLPTTCAPGSTAICAANSKVYILNGAKVWTEI